MELLTEMTQSELIALSSKNEMALMDFVISKGMKSEDLEEVMRLMNLNYRIGLMVGVKNEKLC